ncbi:MAG TPA: hypothetical protein EYO15_03775 [Marine Group III euryarchaeote]|jgi:hypothetical protein|uniref:DUF1616 domain-containing protein n=1 Tax=Marine Group III euryarchaeote TaxID=2173149 RepID=A0A7J4D1I0_9ARCH|nr:hypothetical protein [Marine Group III euryarchaeote]
MILGPQQRKIIIKFGVGIMALLLVFVCYSYVIPRTEVEIDTVYHSSYSALFVQSKISNTGTKQISNLKIKSSVWNGTEMLETDTHYPGVLNAKQSVKLPPLIFDGPHSDSYELLINLEFIIDGEKQTLTYNYEIADYGNLAWHDQYMSF